MFFELKHGIDINVSVGTPFYALLIWILFDILTGLLRAGKDRKLNSLINDECLIRKRGELLAVVVLTSVDVYFNTDRIIARIVVYALIIYETISIIENFKEIGVDVNFIMKYFDKDKYKDGVKERNGK